MKKELFDLLQINPEDWGSTVFVNVFSKGKLYDANHMRAQLCSSYVVCNKVVNAEIEGITIEKERWSSH
jgi:hypothetical protein